MAKLETQYENYLKEVPTSNHTFDEWLTEVWEPDMEDISDWDVTLEDGLDDLEE
jgi:hypothetical protein